MNSIFCGIEKLSLVDFDGYISCTLFTSGCNYRCPFCHNSPLIEEQPSLKMEEILNYLSVRKKMLDAVVITGGEPTLHKELPSVLKQIKDLGYIIKLDTNGTNPKMLKELIDKKLIDYVAMDIKASSNCYSLVTGVINPFLDNIKESINILKTSNINFEFRTTLVKEFHSLDSINEMKELVSGSKKLYLQKFVLRDTCLNQKLHEVDLETAKCYKSILEEVVEKVSFRGY
jgi:pyruvate formate lyase activating enzyme